MASSHLNWQTATSRQYSNSPEAIRSRARREYILKFQGSWIRRRREEWIEENGPCVDCGSSDRLEVDHRDPATKKISVRALWGMRSENPARVEELAKCQVLCHSCHKQKTAKENSKRLKGRPMLYERCRDSRGRFLPEVVA